MWVFCAKNWDVQVDSVTFWDVKRLDRPRGSVTVPKGRLEFEEEGEEGRGREGEGGGTLSPGEGTARRHFYSS